MSVFSLLKSMLNVIFIFLNGCICICCGASVNSMVWQQRAFRRFSTIQGKCLSGLIIGTASYWYNHVSLFGLRVSTVYWLVLNYVPIRFVDV